MSPFIAPRCAFAPNLRCNASGRWWTWTWSPGPDRGLVVHSYQTVGDSPLFDLTPGFCLSALKV